MDYDSHVNAVVDWFGPTDFLLMDICGSRMVHDDINSPESKLIGGAIQENKDKASAANPITYYYTTVFNNSWNGGLNCPLLKIA